MNSTYKIGYSFFLNTLVSLGSIINSGTKKFIIFGGGIIKKGFQCCGRHRIITDKNTGDEYLERYYLFLKDRKDFPFNIFVHKFLKSDPDDLHDHPWSYFTCILRGGYMEHTPSGKFWRKPFTCRCGKPEDLHRIELDPSVGDCWTLFIPGQKKKDWGFMTDKGWIPNKEYTNKVD
tara:strand:- start:46 stop:573 length:528 start_codon:yes stop_codon:yes gene_type:complete